MAPRNASKAQSTGSETPLRRSRRGKQDDTASVQKQIDPNSDEPKGKQSTAADLIRSPQRVLRQRGRSNKQEEVARPQQSPRVLEDFVQAGGNLGKGVRTRSSSGAREGAEQERVLLENAL